MKIKMILTVVLFAYAVAEPPVGEYYPESVQRSLSEEYGPPSARNQLSPTYGPPELQNGRLSNSYLPPQNSFTTDSVGFRSPSQEYGVPSDAGLSVTSARISDGYNVQRSGLSQEYGVPQRFGQDFNAFSQVSGRSQFRPASRFIDTSVRDLTRQYGVPKTRSQTLKSQTGLPQIALARSGVPQGFTDKFETQFPSDSYGAPIQRSGISTEYSVPQTGFRDAGFRSQVSQTYGVPQNPQAFSKSSKLVKSQSLSSTYGVPKISSQYGVPKSFQNPSETYGVPSQRSQTDGYQTLSNSYLPPTVRDMPSSEYGVPRASQGYNYARNALDELLNQEPANYDFGYKVNDLQTGSDFGHRENRQEDKAEGSYFVVLPDGTKQVVEYEADDHGFRPRISVEAVDQGYDDNAQDLTKSGPY